MSNYSQPLNADGWSKHYNVEKLNSVVETVRSGGVSIWSKELVNICAGDVNCLEVGCGSGVSSLWLAKNGKKVTALDYSASSIELVKKAAEVLELDVNTIQFDATCELPFKEKEFDYIFQCGLLEHFETDEQVRLLKEWKKSGKYMISMIPNAASIPYQVGKKILEDADKWEYGLEIPKHSMAKEFTMAGIDVENEYTIGTEWALRFLPKRHYIRKFFAKLEKDGYKLEEYMQGYLLVTIGRC